MDIEEILKSLILFKQKYGTDVRVVINGAPVKAVFYDRGTEEVVISSN